MSNAARARMEPDRVIRSRYRGPNVPRWERLASALVGAGLVAMGVRRGRLGGAALAALGSALIVRGATGRCPVYRMRALRKGVEVRRAITIDCSPSEVYELWRDLRNLPRFMAHVQSVDIDAQGISTWTITEGPATLTWRAEITEDTPNRRLRWRSLPGGDLDHEGTLDLHEAPGGRGTVVDLRLLYRPPGGAATAGLLAGLVRHFPRIQLGEELARLRMLIETGELATGASHPAELHDAKLFTAREVQP
jgi:uncharacterized membrane protein